MSEVVLWSSYPSWRQFSWLYLMAALVAGRALLFWRFGFPGWSAWMAGAFVLLGTAALMRRWAHYTLTSDRLIVSNGYTGREISAVALGHVDGVLLLQGPIASLLGIGTVVVTSGGQQVLRFRGLSDPETVKERVGRAIMSKDRSRAVNE
ncbi:MAG: hypothetical protein K0S45_4236 [Nitrospira sp.]|jgi:membrane protein YdbS with pleckstrin-like domain|nr:hypothetical protein [Nitrospira sp.]